MSASAHERVSAYGNVRLTECDWKVKRGFEKASASRVVRLQECPLAESWMYSYSKSTLDRSSRHSRPLEMSTSFFKQGLVSKQV